MTAERQALICAYGDLCERAMRSVDEARERANDPRIGHRSRLSWERVALFHQRVAIEYSYRALRLAEAS